ncbi:MAG: radical SAM protein [PVC group bacterium]
MNVKMILPTLTEAFGPYWRSIKYSLFPPLGLATLASYLEEKDEIEIQDEHVEELRLDDRPDLVAIQVYVTSAYRAYEIADYYRSRGVHVALGGLHVTSLPDEAARHADTIFLGPGEDTWPRFLRDFRAGSPRRRYTSRNRTLIGLPKMRRELIKRYLYLVPNSIIVSRGCPYHCDFCYKDPFFRGGKSFYTRSVDDVLEEINQLPGRHLYFLDDNLFADRRFALALFERMRGVGRLWQAAATVRSVFDDDLLRKAEQAGLRSLFIGFETLDRASLKEQGKEHNANLNYQEAVRRIHDAGIMINGSFIFGMDNHDESVFGRTVEWAVEAGIETATFHILTPYPGTALYDRMAKQGRLLHRNWDLYDTRHVVYRPAGMTPAALEEGYWRAYRHFYRWGSIMKGANSNKSPAGFIRHLALAGGWKKSEPLWDWIIRHKQIRRMRPLLESILSEFGRHPSPGLSDPGRPSSRSRRSWERSTASSHNSIPPASCRGWTG